MERYLSTFYEGRLRHLPALLLNSSIQTSNSNVTSSSPQPKITQQLLNAKTLKTHHRSTKHLPSIDKLLPMKQTMSSPNSVAVSKHNWMQTRLYAKPLNNNNNNQPLRRRKPF
jgi:sulfopyruvate decarboxylase TPP-binding subunit